MKPRGPYKTPYNLLVSISISIIPIYNSIFYDPILDPYIITPSSTPIITTHSTPLLLYYDPLYPYVAWTFRYNVTTFHSLEIFM